MQTYNKAELIHTLQKQTEDFIDIAVQEWQMLSPVKFTTQPAQGSWSAMQCLAHLNSYGDYYLPAIKNAMDKAAGKQKKNSEKFTSGILGNYFTNIMKPNAAGQPAKKYKAPANHSPNNEGDSDAVIATFIEQQEQLLQLLEKAKVADLNTIRVPISISKFIRLKLGDVFMFLVAHNHRHVLQAERALVNSVKAKATQTS